jgi:hypothetical protein
MNLKKILLEFKSINENNKCIKYFFFSGKRTNRLGRVLLKMSVGVREKKKSQVVLY